HLDRDVRLPPDAPGAAPRVPRGRELGRPAGPLRRVAPLPRTGVRLPVRGRVARHRRPNPAPRGRQSLPSAARARGTGPTPGRLGRTAYSHRPRTVEDEDMVVRLLAISAIAVSVSLTALLVSLSF